MANTLQKTDAILKYTLAEFINNLGFAQTAYRGVEADYKKYQGLALGDTFRLRKPVRHGVADGATLVIQDTNERDVEFPIEKEQNIGFEFDTSELSLYAVEDFYKKYLRNDIQVLASEVDKYCADKLRLGLYHSTGVAGTPIASDTVISETDSLLAALGVPMNPRYVGISPLQYHTMRSGMKSYFNPQLNKDILYKGMVGELYEFDFHRNQNTPFQTAGSGEGTAIANGKRDAGTVQANVTSGNTIGITGLPVSTTGVFKAGDVIEIPAVYKTNEVTKATVTYPSQFVIQADADSDGSGDTTVTVLPEIFTVATSPYQNFSGTLLATSPVQLIASPSAADNTVAVPHVVNAAYYEEALMLCVPPLVSLPGLAYSKSISDPDTNISMRLSNMSDINSGKHIWRLDIIYGGLVNGEYGCRIHG